MFRDDLVAAHARIDSLERQVKEARASASEEAAGRIAKLEAELARERRKVQGRSGAGIHKVLVALGLGAIAVFFYMMFTSRDATSFAEQCSEGDGHMCLGWGINLERSDVKGAEKAYVRACELGEAQGCFNAGVLAFRERSDRAAATTMFRKACALNYGVACANLSALIDDRTEKLAVARKACDLGVALGCTNAASTHSKDKQWTAALPFAQQGCDGGSVGGCQNLAEALVMTGDKTKALAAATRAIHINEQHPSAHATLGSVLVLTGDLEEALVHYKRAFALEHNAGGNERPMLDEPIAVSIKKDLAGFRAVYPASGPAIDDALKRLAELPK